MIRSNDLLQIISGFKKLEGCPTDGTDNAASHFFAQIPMAEEACKQACTHNPACDFYVNQLMVCYLGDFEDVNPLPKPALLFGSIDVYLKDASNETKLRCEN